MFEKLFLEIQQISHPCKNWSSYFKAILEQTIHLHRPRRGRHAGNSIHARQECFSESPRPSPRPSPSPDPLFIA